MPSACDSLIDDIEDMVSSSDPTPHERQSARKSIMPRFRKKKEPLSQEELHTDSLIPGTQKIWMKTWGCSHNNSDGEYMAGQLAASGYKMTDGLKRTSYGLFLLANKRQKKGFGKMKCILICW
ncbi:Threonylcarbamoyladenosine tRNA methylthiotransferase [Dissostichus eleginoides]|uniref:Threonylcarbamoyladenosine tRNA methylthiotransferase n=1 Tax=Dissostichus eleginoides TaxID=100907 RepID=A0AAD9C4N3_DISEL|nr:Threonylcarbamoyladenosine tRNA methylthiotransferase [Dissostichus eleginoides]